ncbi:atlastin-like [Sitodiplosis mosellana]|uniref:atlastin-like n=1 Tax=Sitodiplosis mosellana TaxID=263140 RepID=UPI002443DCE8|nr:atlastin-like [Sitodiplosis mosellana]
MKFICVLICIGTLCHKITAEAINSATAIQIVSPVNHTFNLELNEFRKIVEDENMKNRQVVVVSIAGAFRQGKSFLLNFFLKYLYAQYKTHDVSDWLGEQSRGNMRGFKWRAGRKRETTGIWMWSEIFTHDSENGEKIAIILLDTQGIFDDKSTIRDCTTIFALSMMLSSVQCYNVMQNIKEDDLQHLELFTEYGRLALEQSNIKPFQKLLFIVRDWPYAFETNYGWHGQKVIDDILAGNDEQTNDMRQLRKRIDSSFDDINAFLMPFPGTIVAQSNNFTGDLNQIHPDFVKYVKELTPALFDPGKVTIKKINGQNVRVRDLVPYLEAYIKIFNSDKLPEPRSVYNATAEASSLILQNDCVNLYVDSMQKAVTDIDPYFSETELMNVHQKFKNQAIDQFQKKPKLGDDRFLSSVQQKIESAIEEHFRSFNQTNEGKRKHFIEKANLHNVNLITGIKNGFEEKILAEVGKTNSDLKQSTLNGLYLQSKQAALQQFETMKMGGSDISGDVRVKLEYELDDYHLKLMKMAELFSESLNIYTNSMRESIGRVNPYFDESGLIRTHQDAKQRAVAKFSDNAKSANNELAYNFQTRIDKYAEEMFAHFRNENEDKRKKFVEKANSHNENLIREIKVNFENKMLKEISRSYLNDNAFYSQFMTSKNAALGEFGNRKIGGGEISNVFRERLERDVDSLQGTLKQANERNKPTERPVQHEERGGFSDVEKIIGGIVAIGTLAGLFG